MKPDQRTAIYNEGKAQIKKADAFLNPASMALREISVALVNQIADKSTTILDPTAATGIRGIRYYLETKAKKITLLDINKQAYGSLRRNLILNKVKAERHNTSIQLFANTQNRAFDIIDLDPFGSAVPYINDLMRLCKDGTYLFVTATDTAVLCGAHEKACIRIYNTKPMHNELCHETGLRILMGYIAAVAAQYNFGIDVLLSISHRAYMRVFLKINRGANAAIESIKSTGYAQYCNGCGYRGVDKTMVTTAGSCPLCGRQLCVAGRMWVTALHNKKCVESTLQVLQKNKAPAEPIKLLATILNELDLPLYYSIPAETKRLRTGSVSPFEVIAYLNKKKIKATPTHFDSDAIKTHATPKQLHDAIIKIHARKRQQ